MIKDLQSKKIIRNAFCIFIVGAIIFAFFAFWNYFLFFGWVAGSLISIFCFFINILLIQKIFEIKPKEKTFGFILGFTRFSINLLIHCGFFVSIIYLNKFLSQHFFENISQKNFINPINIFTYILGISIIMASTFIFNIIKSKTKKGAN